MKMRMEWRTFPPFEIPWHLRWRGTQGKNSGVVVGVKVRVKWGKNVCEGEGESEADSESDQCPTAKKGHFLSCKQEVNKESERVAERMRKG